MDAPEHKTPEIPVDEHGRKIYRPNGQVLHDFLFDDSHVSIIQGPINSGTSSCSCMRIWRHATQQRKGPDGKRKSKWAVVRNTFPELKSTTVETWLDWFPEELYGRFTWGRPFMHEVRVGDIELDVIFISLDSPDDIKKLRSLELTGVWFNELEFIPKYLFDEAESRTGRYPAVKAGGSTWSGVIADMNAPPDDHWVPLMRGDIEIPEWMTPQEAREYEKPDDWEFYTQPPGLIEVKDDRGTVIAYEENPDAENLRWQKPHYYLNVIKGKSKGWIDSRVLNKVGVIYDGQPVFPTFDEHDHMASEALKPVAGIPIIVGLDFGRTPAAIFCQNVRGNWVFLRELVASEMEAVTFAPIVRKECDTRYPGFEFTFYGDPAGDHPGQEVSQTCFDIFRAEGMVVHAADGGNRNNPKLLHNAMTSALGRRGGILISPACRTFKNGMRGGYHYRKLKVSGAPKYAATVEKNRYSHVVEAGCYAVLGGGESRTMVKRPAGGVSKINVRKRYVRGRRGRAA